MEQSGLECAGGRHPARDRERSPRASHGGRAGRRAAGHRPAVSQHLKVLKDAGLVSERAGEPADLPAQPAGVAALRDQLDTFWRRAMSGFEQTPKEEDR